MIEVFLSIQKIQLLDLVGHKRRMEKFCAGVRWICDGLDLRKSMIVYELEKVGMVQEQINTITILEIIEIMGKQFT